VLKHPEGERGFGGDPGQGGYSGDPGQSGYGNDPSGFLQVDDGLLPPRVCDREFGEIALQRLLCTEVN
jgi:hypothetical protein